MSKLPSHFTEEKNKGLAIIGAGAVSTILLLLHLLQLAPPIAYALGREFNKDTWPVLFMRLPLRVVRTAMWRCLIDQGARLHRRFSPRQEQWAFRG